MRYCSFVSSIDYFLQNALGLPVAKAMMSEDGECIEWKYNLLLDGPAEVWLLGLEHTMRVVLREVCACFYQFCRRL
jgi:hypothetical protein